LGRLADLLDDLAQFDAVMDLCPDRLKLLLSSAPFCRCGHNFQVSLRHKYDRSHGILRLYFEIFENPVQFGLLVQMNAERKSASVDRTAWADRLLFNFMNENYLSLDDLLRQ
jgi:hypothetical protein